MNLLELLLAFLRPGVDEGETGPDDIPAERDPDPDPDPEPELEIADPADEPAPEVGDKDEPSPELTAAQQSAKAEKERADRYEREMAELRRTQNRPPEDEVTREENAKLADEKTSPLEKWQIQANRELRRGRSEAQLALAQAHDVSDRTSFAAIAQTNPALHKRYAARVEETLANMRAKGFNAPRETILDNLVGKDMRDGKFAKKAKPAATDSVARGKLPGARSDVTGKGRMSEHEKRVKRLENVQI